jgi:hypothetical protein
MSTAASATGAQALLTLTTVMFNLTGSPVRLSRMSRRKKSCSEGYGPMVSLGVTAQLVAEPAGVGVVPVVVAGVVSASAVGLVGVPLHAAVVKAAPAAPRRRTASRRLNRGRSIGLMQQDYGVP